MAIPTRPAGWPWWTILLGFLILVGIGGGLIMLGRSWDPVHGLLSWLGRARKPHVAEVATPATFEHSSNGLPKVWLPAKDEAWKAEQARLAKLIQAQEEQNKKILAELEALKKRKVEGKAEDTKEKKPPAVKRAPGIKISHDPWGATGGRPTYVLAPGATKLGCQIEMAMNSDVGDSYFTCRVTRRVMDTATGQHELVSQNDTILAKDEGANITVGNELLPALATTLTRRDGSTVDLGQVPVTDAIGINGLASEVNHHYVRNVLAGFMLGVVNAGRQIVRQQVATEAGILVNSPSRVVEQTLNRGIDTRPTILVHAGELGNVVLLKPLSLEEVL